jgi:predicted metal-dependent HD superfamily phosphohydrolase
MKISLELLKKIEKYTTDLIKNTPKNGLVYHTIDHTWQVVKNAEIIGAKENFSIDEMNILLASAWFHDTGYVNSYKGHEEESVVVAADFLKLNKIESDIIQIVSDCISATAIPQKPTNKIAEALCDADMMHLGMGNYFEFAENLRLEIKYFAGKKYKKYEFLLDSVLVFEEHSYFTKYCQEEITKIKENNFEELKEKISKWELKMDTKSVKPLKYSRGVDSMLKLTARNQINLSSIADNKSNILISLNGIIISLGLAGLVRKFQVEPAIIIPTVIFITFSLSTIILAILSTRPHISSGKFTRDDIKNRKVNLLFFGNFYNMELEDYEWAIGEMINDDKYLYSTMTKDQYSLGKVLARKYRLLRWAYNIFMIGLVVSVGAFLIVFLNI